MIGLQRVCPGGRGPEGSGPCAGGVWGRGRIETGGVILNIDPTLSDANDSMKLISHNLGLQRHIKLLTLVVLG